MNAANFQQAHLNQSDTAASSPSFEFDPNDAERRLRQAAEACADWLILLDRNLHIVFANRGANGHVSQELRGRSVLELVPHADRERALQCMRGVLQIGAPDRFEFEMLGPRGTPRHIEMRVSPVREQQQIVALTLNGSDTTQHVLAQRAVATQAKMIESMLEGVALINEAGLIAITNPAFDALFGHSRGMLIGRSLASLADALDFSSLSRAATLGAAPLPLEFEARRPDGTVVTLSGAISQLDDAERRHGLLVLQDVGERKHLERALLDAVSREQDRIGNDLHDGLGQELTGIALMLRCLAGRLQAEHGSAPPEIEGITQLLNHAVENTRSLARGLSPVHLERGGLRDALEGLAMHARTVYGIKAAFTDKLSPETAVDTEIANQLYRIAQEAVTNAVKHGRAQTVRIYLSATHGKLRLTIADDGCGMTAADAEKRNGQSSGGMGLRIMRYRARIARGDVRFERGQPSGTRVICECPMEACVPRQADRSAIARSHALSSEESRARIASHRPHRPSKTPTAPPTNSSRRSTHATTHSKSKLKMRAKGART